MTIMKNIFKILPFVCMALCLQNCEQDEIVFEEDTFVQLANTAAASVVENSGDVVTISAVLGAPQLTPTTVNFDVVGDPSRFTITPGNSVTIPAGETSGSISFSAVDDELINGDTNVQITLSETSGLPVGIAGEGLYEISKSITIVDDNVPCNDYVLVVLTDAFPQETTWDIVDANGVQVYTGGQDYGPSSSAASRLKEYVEAVPLEDGCYTFTIYDAYGDGLADGVVEGSWNLGCGALVVSSGSGNFGASDSTEFCVNQ
jgi:hypothetical protein